MLKNGWKKGSLVSVEVLFGGSSYLVFGQFYGFGCEDTFYMDKGIKRKILPGFSQFKREEFFSFKIRTPLVGCSGMIDKNIDTRTPVKSV